MAFSLLKEAFYAKNDCHGYRLHGRAEQSYCSSSEDRRATYIHPRALRACRRTQNILTYYVRSSMSPNTYISRTKGGHRLRSPGAKGLQPCSAGFGRYERKKEFLFFSPSCQTFLFPRQSLTLYILPDPVITDYQIHLRVGTKISYLNGRAKI